MIDILFKQVAMSTRKVYKTCLRCNNDVPIGNHYYLDRGKVVCEMCLRDSDFINLKDTFKVINETFFYYGVCWNVGAIIEDINNGVSFSKFRVETRNIKSANFGIIVDPDRVDDVDVSVNGIMVDLGYNGKLVIDGHHRIEKAFRSGVEVLDFELLSFKEQVRYLVFLNRKELLSYISRFL